MNKSGLLVRLAVVIAFSSLAVGLISAQIFYRLTFLNEVAISHLKIEQLTTTVASTASIAAYLGDSELAKEVVVGLKTNDLVKDAKITILDPNEEAKDQPVDENALSFPLYSPFEEKRVVGTIFITPELDYIRNHAQKIGENNSTALIAQAFVVTFIAIFIAYILITRPMIQIAERLHVINPGSSNRVQTPDFHQESELGSLVKDINTLLERAESQINQERQLRNDIEVLEKRFRMLFENSVSPIVLMEPRGSILLFNSAFKDLLKKINQPFKKNMGPLLATIFEEEEYLLKSVQKSLTNEEIATGEYKLINHESDESFWVQIVVTSIISDDMKEYYQVTLHDISRRKKELEQLSKLADFDQLTQLLNRHAAEKKIREYILQKVRFSVILMDLNGFKQVNDVYGHDSGDQILMYVSGVLQKSVRRDDIASRWGGDEFVLILKNIDKVGVETLLAKIMGKITRPYFLAEHNVHVNVGASIGVAFSPDQSEDMQDLVQKADQAMYAAKKRKEKNPEQYLQFSEDLS